MIAFGGTQGKGMLAAAARYRSAVERSPAEEPEAVAPVVDVLLSESYSRRQTPEGENWSPRKFPTGRWPLLEKTGTMRASQLVMPVPGGVSMSYDDPAQRHQAGTTRMAARPLLPRTYPPTWAARIGKARIAWWRKALVST